VAAIWAGADSSGKGYAWRSISDPVGERPGYDALVDKHGLSILMQPGDFSLRDGGLRMTEDGDIQIGDAIYSAMFRLVQAWRFSCPHLAQVFALSVEMAAQRAWHDEKVERIAVETYNTYDWAEPAQDHFAPLREAFEASDALELGQKLYAGCAMLLLDGILRRFGDDISAGAAWRDADPKFNGISFGRFVVASANSFRHADEWAKTHPPNDQQRRSQDVLKQALAWSLMNNLAEAFDCANALAALSDGWNFERLEYNLLMFGHNVALTRRSLSGDQVGTP
jgi:hypothetical protein